MNGSFFVYTFAIGQFTNISYVDYNVKTKRFLGKFYYFMQGFKEFFKTKKIEVIDSKNNEIYFIILLLNSLRIASFKIKKPNKLNDGMINIVLFKNTTFLNFVNLISFLFFGILLDPVSIIKTNSYEFKTKKEVEYNLDGELGGVAKDFKITVEKESLLFYIPEVSKKYF